MANDTVRLPHAFAPRSYQRGVFRYVQRGGTRGVLVHHRRAGKDKTALNLTIAQMFARKGTYLHLFPTYNQGKKILWDGIDANGLKYLDHFPPQIVAAKSEQEMQITTVNGSIWQIVGTDNVDRLVGTNPVGCVFSEYALQDPRAWDYLRPILRENGGWALFVFTPRGKNHAWTLYQLAQANPQDWYLDVRTVEDTRRDAPGESGLPVLTAEDLDADRREGMAEELIQQEYYVSFEAGLVGSYYGHQLAAARQQGRIGFVPHDPGLPVETAWDIGIGDSTAIWFKQVKGLEIRYIDYYEASGVGVDHYAGVLREKPYVYSRHVAPHDIDNREWGSSGGKTRLETARDLGIRFQVAHKWPVDDGIAAVRRLFPRYWFDATRCQRGIDAIENYQKRWDDKRKMFLDQPYHSWASHGADALRYDAVMFREPERGPQRPLKVEMGFDAITDGRGDITIEVEQEWDAYER
jgi:phage terminase large subunit